MKHSWLRLRGNASGRTKDRRFVAFFCDGCQRDHGRYVVRTKTLDGKVLCDRQYYKHMSKVATVAGNREVPAANAALGVTAGETA